ncbi:YhdH/YhfP family quinone oxidoreductase [Dyadobacter sediminis]|uniref:Acryloyl-CoA reductase n=1 Tax=Dyadobacter sediminis TaxID=1493691 RepID=A0A5R9KCA5_9BACT|nr:YhdH/YhfP family quinone oxidoreductase [Dyadobacter sediminis]TLU92352.1 acryloyl-CoA reductase [Dyadobacter sediminis]
MNAEKYKALEVTEEAAGKFALNIVYKSVTEPLDGEVLVRVRYSSLNYKDALSASGNRGVTRQYPHTPGVDAAGVIAVSRSPDWEKGDEVIVTGFDLGMNTNGGFAEYITVPSKWLVRLPEGLSLRQSMAYGTAGFTAGLSIMALIRHGMKPENGAVAVTGATGGVGSAAVAMLAKLGYHVMAVSSKAASHDFLLSMGAREVIPRQEVEDQSGKALLKPRFAAAIDTVGGQVLATVIKSLHYGGVVTTCGMVNGGELHTTVFPFILKGVQLIGIDSVATPHTLRAAIWQKLAAEWMPPQLELLTHEIGLEQLPEAITTILNGKMQGRTIVRI